MSAGAAIVARGLAMLRALAALWNGFARGMAESMPKGLFARSLLIVILPMLILQLAVAYFFMERHWQLVTYRLSTAMSQDIAFLVDATLAHPAEVEFAELRQIAATRQHLDISILKGEDLPRPLPKSFFSLIDPLNRAMTTEIARQIGKPYWIDTIGRSNLIEVRIKLGDDILRVVANRNSAYASNSHIFLVWMLGTSLVLLGVAIAFLRNQIRPIQRLALAAEDFGKGREHLFRPAGAREVRQAGHAFIDMKRRVERTMEQRTAMLNGVSHDLRTILTRFKLSLALMGNSSEAEDLARDVTEMQRMLEAYLAFARGDSGEISTATNIRSLLEELKSDAERHGHATRIEIRGAPVIVLRPNAFKRCLYNLVANAQRYGDRIEIEAVHDARYLTVRVDDDGPGIPADKREEAFRPFIRLDEARNQDVGGTGLGLAIARDIARAHGGDIVLGQSPLGGLRATVRVPA